MEDWVAGTTSFSFFYSLKINKEPLFQLQMPGFEKPV